MGLEAADNGGAHLSHRIPRILTCHFFHQARKTEGELDVKLSAYNKLCSGFEANYRARSDDQV